MDSTRIRRTKTKLTGLGKPGHTAAMATAGGTKRSPAARLAYGGAGLCWGQHKQEVPARTVALREHAQGRPATRTRTVAV